MTAFIGISTELVSGVGSHIGNQSNLVLIQVATSCIRADHTRVSTAGRTWTMCLDAHNKGGHPESDEGQQGDKPGNALGDKIDLELDTGLLLLYGVDQSIDSLICDINQESQQQGALGECHSASQ
jgi:hypothetical protein